MDMHNRQILKLALPAIVTNITVPLLGLVDTAIVGHMGHATYLAAIAVGSMIFNLVYWVFGFLRMGTSGLTAQAWGRRDRAETVRLLSRSALVSLFTAMFILLLQVPLCELMMWFIGPTPDVRPLAVTYYHIVVWGAPAVLGLYGLSGWFIGMQNTRLPMVVSILQNVVNIVASLTLVYGFDMKVEGVALGTVMAQYVGLVVGLVLVWRCYKELIVREKRVIHLLNAEVSASSRLAPFVAFLRVNRDIFLRTLFLVAVNLYFTSVGARQGATILAVNTLLLQLYLLFSYVMDGFAFAGEALGGRYWGAADYESFHAVVRRLFTWGTGMTVLFTAVYVLGGMPFLRLLTDEPGVVDASQEYVWWAYLIPAAGVAAFVWDGIFIGITQTRGMLWSSCLAALLFFATVLLLVPQMGNHGLWLAMVLYLLARGLVQSVIYWQRYLIIDNR